MSIPYLDAKDEVYGMVNTAFTDAASGITPSPRLSFAGAGIAPPPNVDAIQADCSFVVVTSSQASLSNNQGKSLFQDVAMLTLQIYAPKKAVGAFRSAEQLGEAVRTRFCKPGVSGEVWFRDQRLSPVAGNETRDQVNVIVICTYKTLK